MQQIYFDWTTKQHMSDDTFWQS